MIRTEQAPPLLTAAQLIETYTGPQWLIAPIGEPVDREELQAIRESRVTIGDRVTGWHPYSHVIHVDSNGHHRDYLATIHPPYQYSDDPADVTRVWWSVASENVQDYDDDTQDWVDGPNDDERMQHVLDAIAAHVAATYPNAHDVWIVDGGYENQYASFSPRVDNDHESGPIPYEHGLDDMIAAEDRAIAEAFAKYPTPEGAN